MSLIRNVRELKLKAVGHEDLSMRERILKAVDRKGLRGLMLTKDVNEIARKSGVPARLVKFVLSSISHDDATDEARGINLHEEILSAVPSHQIARLARYCETHNLRELGEALRAHHDDRPEPARDIYRSTQVLGPLVDDAKILAKSAGRTMVASLKRPALATARGTQKVGVNVGRVSVAVANDVKEDARAAIEALNGGLVAAARAVKKGAHAAPIKARDMARVGQYDEVRYLKRGNDFRAKVEKEIAIASREYGNVIPDTNKVIDTVLSADTREGESRLEQINRVTKPWQHRDDKNTNPDVVKAAKNLDERVRDVVRKAVQDKRMEIIIAEVTKARKVTGVDITAEQVLDRAARWADEGPAHLRDAVRAQTSAVLSPVAIREIVHGLINDAQRTRAVNAWLKRSWENDTRPIGNGKGLKPATMPQVPKNGFDIWRDKAKRTGARVARFKETSSKHDARRYGMSHEWYGRDVKPRGDTSDPVTVIRTHRYK